MRRGISLARYETRAYKASSCWILFEYDGELSEVQGRTFVCAGDEKGLCWRGGLIESFGRCRWVCSSVTDGVKDVLNTNMNF